VLSYVVSDDPTRFEKRIYIPLPGSDARKRMFEIHVGDTPCELTQKDYRTLGQRTDGFVTDHRSPWSD
jgi:SpoVK/Ycf46/Vps4 family AAA+-type ATPase